MNGYFYHSLFRKYILYFGTVFNNISIVRKNTQNAVEQIVNVPIVYGPKAHWLTRLRQDPLVDKSTSIELPRMSFEIIGMNYDGDRKLQTTNKISTKREGGGLITSMLNPVPYDINFQLTIYSKNADDALQIVEQILPYFKPDYTATLNLVDGITNPIDIPIILSSVINEDSYEGSMDADKRYIFYTLMFNMKAYFWGPTSKTGLIKKAIINFFTDTNARRSTITYEPNIGQFARYEYIEQEQDNGKVAQGILYFSNTSTLQLHSVEGNFEPGLITGLTTNAVATALTINTTSYAGERLVVVPTMLPNGSPTSNASLSVPYQEIGPGDTYGISVNIEDL